MPIFDYKCTDPDCGHVFDRMVRRHTSPNPECEKCGHEVKRLIGSPGLIFKGEGWARDGYAKKD